MAQEERTITWRLSDPGMGTLERAGLAALYMTLRAAEEQLADLRPLRWTASDLTSDGVTLRWSGKDEDAFLKLFTWAWQVRDGVFYLPGVHREPEQRDFAYRRVSTHNGILGTFLQHPLVQPRSKGKDRTILVEHLEENRPIQVRFLAIDPKLHGVKPLKDLKSCFEKGLISTNSVSLSGWVMPGIAPRYGPELDAKKAWQGAAERAILLMLTPIACMYLRLLGKGVKAKGKDKTSKGKKSRKRVGTNWIFVVPEVLDLKQFDEGRPSLVLSPDAVDVASLGDAALRFAARYATRPLEDRTCFVVAMGQLSFYNPGQNVRKGVLEVKPLQVAVTRYRHLMRELPNSTVWVKRSVSNNTSSEEKSSEVQEADENEEGFFKIPSGRGRIADNLILGKPWYADLCVPLDWDLDELERQREREKERVQRQGNGTEANISKEKLWFRNICYQRRSLMELIQEREMWDSESERYFVEAFWEILASLYAQEVKAVERGGARKIEERLGDLNEGIRRSLMRAKTRVLLRGYLAELFAKGGRQPTLVQNRSDIWKLMDHPYEWKKARDLALLALTTYQSKEKREQSQTKSSNLGDKGGQS